MSDAAQRKDLNRVTREVAARLSARGVHIAVVAALRPALRALRVTPVEALLSDWKRLSENESTTGLPPHPKRDSKTPVVAAIQGGEGQRLRYRESVAK
jgi:hypothetical protein